MLKQIKPHTLKIIIARIFEKAAYTYFGDTELIVPVSKTRIIYIFKKRQRFICHTSVVRKTQYAVLKTFHNYRLHEDPSFRQREIASLRKLAGCPGFPTLLSITNDSLWLTDCGDPADKSNLPGDWYDQALTITRNMEKRDVRHNDIHPGNILEKSNRLYLIDFAWSCGLKDSISFVPQKIGVEFSVRTLNEPINDLNMLLNSLKNILQA